MDLSALSALIKEEALRLGFAACGICRPGYVGEHAVHLRNWLEQGFHGNMAYMERHPDKRSDSGLLFENVRSVIVTALNYYPRVMQDPETARVSYYAYGKDYHDVIKERLRRLLDFIGENRSAVNGRVFCDTAPLLEKYHAEKAGLGWIGKNTQLIIPGKGSFFFLGAILLDIPLEYDTVPQPDRCGACTRCMDACPTKALVAPGCLNANRCLSYLTIEYKGELPDFYKETIGNRIYGCDTCNQVCPWNKAARGNETEAFQPSEELLHLSFDAVGRMDEAGFDRMFKDTPVYRIGMKQLKRNMEHRLNKQTIVRAATSDCSLIRRLASLVWEPTYGEILSPEQLEYMFEWMYSVGSLENQMNSGHVFFILYEGEEPAGYASVEKEGEERYHLQKIYVIPSKQGKSYGLKLLERAEQFVREMKPDGDVFLVLNVNRSNKARYFYEKQGFSVESEGDFNIGNGFYMNDYIMVKPL